MSRFKIAILANSDWNLYNFRLALAKTLEQEGYQVYLFCPPGPYVAQIKAAGFRLKELQYLDRKSKNPWKELLLLLEIRKYYRQNHIDLALQYTIKPNIYGSLAGAMAITQTISTITGLGYTFLHKGLSSTVSRFLYKLAFRFCQLVVFQNSDDQAFFIRKGLVKSKKTALVPGSGINTQHFQALPKKATSNTHFLFIGRLLYDKGILEFLKAAQQIDSSFSEVEFTIVGDIDPGNPASLSQEEYQGFFQASNIYHIPHSSDVREQINRADVVVLPSYREGLPRVLLEAMAMAKPIIATDVPGCRELIIPEKNGFLVPAKSVNKLSEAFQDFLKLPPQQKKSMGQYSRKLVLERYDEQIVFQKYLDWIKQCLNG